MVVLLLGLGVMINPSSMLKTSAVEVSEESDGEFSEYKAAAEEIVAEVGAEDTNNVILREATVPSTTFEIDGAGQNEVVETSVDEVAYRSHIVRVSLNNVDEYFLFISGDANLKAPNGGTDLTGVGSNVTGSSITAGRWGYGWDHTGTTANAAMKYNTMPTTQAKLTVPTLSNNAVSFNGKLNFAAKFPTNATLGNYTSNVNLTLIASPKAQTGSVNWRNETGGETALAAGTETMQGIKSGFCKDNESVKEKWTVVLTDNRDNETYTVVKLKNGDGTYGCWMQQNLRLKTDNADGLLLASGDTNLPTGTTWTLPKSLTTLITTNFSKSDYYEAESFYRSETLKTNGVYYSWTAATAGKGGSSSVSSGTITQSICPKGWHLPTVGDTNSSNEFYNLLGTNGVNIGASNATTAFAKIQEDPYLFPAAGLVSGGLLRNEGSLGSYWSSTISFDTRVHDLYFNSSSFLPGTDGNYSFHRYYGLSVRCVANY